MQEGILTDASDDHDPNGVRSVLLDEFASTLCGVPNMMLRRSTFNAFVAATSILFNPISNASSQPDRKANICFCEGWDGQHFNIEDYVKAAAKLQELGELKARDKLVEMTTNDKECFKVFILCRLLFSERKGGDWKQPAVGRPLYLGGTSDNDWPHSPVTFVGDVPIIVVSGYELFGFPEQPLGYLKYCIANCEWSVRPFKGVDRQAIHAAAKDIVTSNKWKRQLTEAERGIIELQAKPSLLKMP